MLMNYSRFCNQMLIIFFFGVSFSSTQPKNDFYSESWALLIGINKYHNETHLNYAVADAERMHRLLTENLDFPANNVFMLLDEEATLINIRNEMKKLYENANERDRVLIYFAGHGITEPLPKGGEEGYLVPIEGDIDNLYTTALPMSEMKRISDRVAAKDMLFLMDACYSGLMSVGNRGLTQEESGKKSLKKIAAGGSRTVITAGRKGEIAQERAQWGHSPFVKNLVSGLEKGMADLNEDTYVTGSELGMYLTNQVTADTDNKQTPDISYFTTDRGDFVFIIGDVVIQNKNDGEDGLSELKEQIKLNKMQMAKLTELMLAQEQQRQQTKEKEAIETQADSKEEGGILYKGDKLEALEEEMKELEEEMQELGVEMGLLTEEMNSLQDEINEAEDMEEGKEEAIKHLKSEMDRVGGEMGRLGGEMGRGGGNMGSVGGEMGKLKRQKKDAVNKLIEKLKDLGIKSDEIEKLSNNIPFIKDSDKEAKLIDNTAFSKSPTWHYENNEASPVWLRYNRAEGFYLQFNKTFQSDIIPGSSFYGGIGRAFHRNEYQWIFGYEQLVFNNIFQFYFEAFDKSITPDAWRVWDGENSMAAIFLKKDYLDWYKGQGFRTAGFIHIKNYISIGAEYNQIDQSIMNTVLDGDKFQRVAYKIQEGDDNYLKSIVTVGYPIDIGVRRKLQFYSSIVRTQSTGNIDNAYTYDHFLLNLLVPYTKDLNFNIKVMAGASDVANSIWNENGYHQHIFEIGGKGTLRGYDWKEFYSTFYFLTTMEIWYDEFGVLYDRAVMSNDFDSEDVHHSAGISIGDEDVNISYIRRLDGGREYTIYFTLAFGIPLQYW